MFQPREYQENSHRDTMNYVNGDKKKAGIVVVPTGGGKSLLQAMLVRDYGENALILSPSIEILTQNYDKFVEFGGEASVYSASLKSREIGNVTYASLASIKTLGKEFKKRNTKLLIMDECHLGSDASAGMFKTFMREMSPKYLVGYTATPFRLSSSMGPSGFPESSLSMLPSTFPKVFDDYIHITQISELIKNKFWADIELEKYEFDTGGLMLNSTGNDFNEDAVIQRNKLENINNKIYKRIKELSKTRKSILVFLDSVDNCEIMKNALGDKCATVNGKTKTKDRKKIIEDFKSGVIQIVCCHSSLVVGFDFPGLDTVIMGRPTNSLAVFYQIYGRLVRPSENKLGLFVDYGGNLSRFGDMHNIVIEDYRGVGHEVFYKDRMISGVPLKGPEVTKVHLDAMVERRKGVMDAIKPDLEHIMTFGKYKDTLITKVPSFYLKWLLSSNLPLDNVLKKTVQHILKIPTSLY